MESYYFKQPPINCVNVITQTVPKRNREQPPHRFHFFIFFGLFQRISYICSVTKAGFKIPGEDHFYDLLNIQNYTYPAASETLRAKVRVTL